MFVASCKSDHTYLATGTVMTVYIRTTIDVHHYSLITLIAVRGRIYKVTVVDGQPVISDIIQVNN